MKKQASSYKQSSSKKGQTDILDQGASLESKLSISTRTSSSSEPSLQKDIMPSERIESIEFDIRAAKTASKVARKDTMHLWIDNSSSNNIESFRSKINDVQKSQQAGFNAANQLYGDKTQVTVPSINVGEGSICQQGTGKITDSTSPVRIKQRHKLSRKGKKYIMREKNLARSKKIEKEAKNKNRNNQQTLAKTEKKIKSIAKQLIENMEVRSVELNQIDLTSGAKLTSKSNASNIKKDTEEQVDAEGDRVVTHDNLKVSATSRLKANSGKKAAKYKGGLSGNISTLSELKKAIKTTPGMLNSV